MLVTPFLDVGAHVRVDGRVVVKIDQAGHDGLPGNVQRRGAGNPANRAGGADANNSVALDQH
jgi:hypothetical protein